LFLLFSLPRFIFDPSLPPSFPPSLPPSSPQQEAALLQTLTKKDVSSFYHSFLLPKGSSRRLLTTQIYPQKTKEGGREGGKEEVKGDGERVEGLVEDELALRATLPKY